MLSKPLLETTTQTDPADSVTVIFPFISFDLNLDISLIVTHINAVFTIPQMHYLKQTLSK